MKKHLLFFLFFIPSILSAQIITFEKVIDTLGAFSANCVRETFDGGYILCGQSTYNGNDVLILKLDSTGFIEWGKTYSGPSMEAANTIEQLPDSGYLVDAGYDVGSPFAKHWLLRLDANGDTLWTKLFSLGVGDTQGFAMGVNTNNFGLTGYCNITQPANIIDAYIVITNALGNNVQQKIFVTPIQSQGYDLCKTYDEGYAISGAIATTSTTADIYLLKLDSLGDTTWTRKHDFSNIEIGNAICQTSDSGYALTGVMQNATSQYNIFLLKTDANGDTIWHKLYYSSYETNGFCVNQTNDKGYIMTGYTFSPGVNNFYNLYLIKTNELGDTLWTRQFGSPVWPDYGYSVKQTKDGGYIISGSTTRAVGGTYIYLIKIDSTGNLATGIHNPETNNAFEFAVYPNPSTDIFNIEINGINEMSALDLYNLNGELLSSEQIQVKNKKQLTFRELPDGIYMLQLTTSKSRVSRKVIVRH